MAVLRTATTNDRPAPAPTTHRIGIALGVLCALALLILTAVAAPGARAETAPLDWSAPASIDTATPTAFQHPEIEGVSCPTRSFCAAVDEQGGVLYSTAPTSGHWTAVRGVAPFDQLNAISCTSRSFCAAVGGLGEVVTSTDPTGKVGGWTLTRHVDAGPQGLTAISCASAHLCVALDVSGNVVTSTDPAAQTPTWRVTRLLSRRGGDSLDGVSCPSVSLCVAVDTDGRLAEVSVHPAGGPGAWKIIKLAGSRTTANAPGAVSCPSRRFCVIIANNPDGAASEYSSTDPAGGAKTWQRTPKINGNDDDGLQLLSCPSASFCVAGVTAGEETLYSTTHPRDGRTWRRTSLPDEPDALVCAPATRLCVAPALNGHLMASAQPTAGKHAWAKRLIDAVNDLTAVACTTTLCTAADSAGNALTSSAPTSAASSWHLAKVGLGPDLACAGSPTFCVDGVPEQGFLSSTDPAGDASAWRSAQGSPASDDAVDAVSCISAQLCIAGYYVGDQEEQVAYGGIQISTDPTGPNPDWTSVNGTLGQNALTALSCPSTALCVGVTGAGQTFSSTAPTTSAWRRRTIDSGHSLTGVSCLLVNLCVAVDDAGNVLTSTDPASGPWTSASIDPGGALSTVTCFANYEDEAPVGEVLEGTLCVAADGDGDIFSSTNPTGGTTAWTEQSGQDRDITSISCASTSECVAVDENGGATVGTATPPPGTASPAP